MMNIPKTKVWSDFGWYVAVSGHMFGEASAGGSDSHHCVGIKLGVRKPDASEALGCHRAAQ